MEVIDTRPIEELDDSQLRRRLQRLLRSRRPPTPLSRRQVTGVWCCRGTILDAGPSGYCPVCLVELGR